MVMDSLEAAAVVDICGLDLTAKDRAQDRDRSCNRALAKGDST
jgi:hypothetical protein